jgi:hypothetical protein
MSDINTIDADLLFQLLNSNTDTSLFFYKNFENLGEETLNLFIELKEVLTSNVSSLDDNMIYYFRELDKKLYTLPTPIQNWFRRYYKNKIPFEVKQKIGFLESLDKWGYNSKLHLINPAQWYNDNTMLPVNILKQKIIPNMLKISKDTYSMAYANFARKQKRLAFCKERCRSVGIKKITTPTNSHGDVGFPVGDYEHPKRMAKIATEYMSKIIDILGRNAKSFFENLNFNPYSKNLQKGIPDINITEIIDGEIVQTNLSGDVKKSVKNNYNPFVIPTK